MGRGCHERRFRVYRGREKQDKSRLPLLLTHYYSEVYREDGTVQDFHYHHNSCTIKTYANLKYMNQVRFRDQFLMIRDGDGKGRGGAEAAALPLLQRAGKKDADRLPPVTEKNVLVLRYYSFEITSSIQRSWKSLESWSRRRSLSDSVRKMERIPSQAGIRKETSGGDGKGLRFAGGYEGIWREFKIHMRGHNVFDIFYGKYKKQETRAVKPAILSWLTGRSLQTYWTLLTGSCILTAGKNAWMKVAFQEKFI